MRYRNIQTTRMKNPKHFFLAMLVPAITASATDPAPSPDATVASIQDNRAADVEAVQAAIAQVNPATTAAIQRAFQEREIRRAAEMGAASLQAELARRATQQSGSSLR